MCVKYQNVEMDNNMDQVFLNTFVAIIYSISVVQEALNKYVHMKFRAMALCN